MNKNTHERKVNFTFSLRPSVQQLLPLIAQKKDISQAKVIEDMIIEKARKLKLSKN